MALAAKDAFTTSAATGFVQYRMLLPLGYQCLFRAGFYA